jgi:hypothetical protein
MPSKQADFVPIDEDARERKRERDKQNQQRKRMREKDAMEELERRNVYLEWQIKMLNGGPQTDIHDLTQTVDALRAQNIDLSRKMKQVDDFARQWVGQSGYASQNASDNYQRMVAPRNHDSFEKLNGNSMDLSATRLHLSDHRSAGTMEHNDRHCADSPSMTLQPAVDFGQVMVSISRLDSILGSPPWQRLPAHSIADRCFDPYGPTVNEMRRSPEKFRMCGIEPKAVDLLLGGSSNELANATYQCTMLILNRRTEKLAIQWTTYMLARVSGQAYTHRRRTGR